MGKIKIVSIEAENLSVIESNEQYVDGSHPSVVRNNVSTIVTEGVGPCIALGVVIIDDKGTIHRIMYHCPYCGEDYLQYEGRIEQYFKTIGNIVNLKAVIASFDTFSEENLSDFDVERGIMILERIKRLFSFWKQNHPDFKIPIIQSSSLEITPNGSFRVDSSEYNLQEYYRKKDTYSEFNTILRNDYLDVDMAYNKLKEYDFKEERKHL